ncbi:hypothetical protein BPAE_0055g00130 [Botrytis paeoniae]|uniref:Uncharacterized protein n=1 Tax=Botrytis paeoniae TaxID=278948 RepID=A0A4Z1FUH6_9HELO|nr:hypothetical protein BPAE_0055g00130 [Botrytis paeoniae]
MFPFIQTCLAVGFTFIPSIGYEAVNDTISMKEFDPELGRSQPYLVFDITDLKDIGYCFFHVGSFKWDSLDQMHAPLNQNQSVTKALSLKILAETKLFSDLHLQGPAKFRRLLDRASVMPSFFSKVISKSREKPSKLSRYYNSRELLGEGLETQSVIDLDHPYNLSSGHILHILKKAMSSMNRGNVTVLSLCGNNLISPAALETILAALPNLKNVYVLNTSGIPLWRKLEILQGRKVSGFDDLELYSMAFKPATGVYSLSLREVNLTLPFLINGFANFLRVLSNPDTNRKHVAHGTRILSKAMAISELDGEMKIAPIANNLFEFNLTRDGKKGNGRMNYTRQKPRVTLPGKWNLIAVSQPFEQFPGAVKHSFCHRYAFIKAKSHGAYAEVNDGQKCTGSVAFIKSYEPQLVVADIDQFLQQVITGEEDDMIIKQAQDFWKRGTALLDLQRCSEAEVKVIAKEAKLLFGIRDDNDRMLLRVVGQYNS